MTMKSVDLPHLRSVVLAGHAGGGKTTLAEQLLFNAGAIPRLGRVDDGTAHLDFEPEEQKRTRVAQPGGRHVRARRHADLAGRHARLPGLRRRGHRGLRRRRRGAVRHGRLGRRRGRSRAGRRPGPQDRDGGLFLHQQVRPRERRPDRRARRAAGGVRRQDRAAPDRDRRGRVVRGATSTSSTARPTSGTARDEVEIPIPDELADEVAHAPRPAAGRGGRGGRRRARQVPRGRGGRPTPSSRRACARASRKASSRRSSSGRRPRASACAALLDAIVRYLPSPADEAPVTAIDKGGAEVEVPADDERSAARPRVQDDRRPVRRAADVPARAVRDAPLAGPRLEHGPRRGRADRPAAAAPRARSRSRSASSRPARSARSPSSP